LWSAGLFCQPLSSAFSDSEASRVKREFAALASLALFSRRWAWISLWAVHNLEQEDLGRKPDK